MVDYTLLSIDGISFSDYAVRGIRMTLTPIDQSKNMARDCRAVLADISLAQFRQYKGTITCTDFEAPDFTDVWPGQDITIQCIPGLGASNDTSGDVLTILAKVADWNTDKDEGWNGAEVAWSIAFEQRTPDDEVTT